MNHKYKDGQIVNWARYGRKFEGWISMRKSPVEGFVLVSYRPDLTANERLVYISPGLLTLPPSPAPCNSN